jgi:hypothetical protein
MLQDCLGEVQMNNIYKYNTKMDSTDVSMCGKFSSFSTDIIAFR